MIQYILQKTFVQELRARYDYLFHTFHLYFLEINRAESVVELRSFPFVPPEIVIIYGHYPWILGYICSHRRELDGKIKIIHSCRPDIVVPFLGQQQVYFCRVNGSGEAVCCDGRGYGIPFCVTESELDALHAAHLSLEKQIQFAYCKVA